MTIARFTPLTDVVSLREAMDRLFEDSFIRPKIPTSRHLLRVAARIVKPTSQPTAAHGKSIAEVRETYGSTYGDSW